MQNRPTACFRSSHRTLAHWLALCILGGTTALSPMVCNAVSAPLPTAPPSARHNLIFFVPDGLRAASIDLHDNSAFAALARDGVAFTNTHAVFPTLTTPNASAFATGHYLGDTGDFGNTLFTNFPVKSAGGLVTPFLEDDEVLGEIDAHFGGNYLDETSVLAAARAAGYQTAAIGKIGPSAIQDVQALSSDGPAMLIDDATGSSHGVPLSPTVKNLLRQAHLPLVTPGRGTNGQSGTAFIPGTLSADTAQQAYFTAVATQALLPYFAHHHLPFAMVYWSRDPDGTQHNQGDSLHHLWPGINGPTSKAGIQNAAQALAALRASLKQLGLADTTNIVVAADHGFSTITKQSRSSKSASLHWDGVRPNDLPPGFLALDLALQLHYTAFDTVAPYAPIDFMAGQLPPHGSVILGNSLAHAQILVVANGGSDLVYILGPQKSVDLIQSVVSALSKEDYVSGIFAENGFGEIPGTLPLREINLFGSAGMPLPALVVSFRSFAFGCDQSIACTVEVADTGLQQGQGMHGGFNRSDTANFVAMAGPDFRAHMLDALPISNADIGMTLAKILHITPGGHGNLIGRVITEALRTPTVLPMPAPPRIVIRSSQQSINGQRTQIREQRYANQRYFDAAGFPGRTVGL